MERILLNSIHPTIHLTLIEGFASHPCMRMIFLRLHGAFARHIAVDAKSARSTPSRDLRPDCRQRKCGRATAAAVDFPKFFLELVISFYGCGVERAELEKRMMNWCH